MNQAFASLAAVDWLEVLRSLAPVVTAWIAFAALKNWRRQDKAKRQAEFLDELIEATHSYVVGVQKPIEMLRMAKIGMAATTWPCSSLLNKPTNAFTASR